MKWPTLWTWYIFNNMRRYSSCLSFPFFIFIRIVVHFTVVCGSEVALDRGCEWYLSRIWWSWSLRGESRRCWGISSGIWEDNIFGVVRDNRSWVWYWLLVEFRVIFIALWISHYSGGILCFLVSGGIAAHSGVVTHDCAWKCAIRRPFSCEHITSQSVFLLGSWVFRGDVTPDAAWGLLDLHYAMALHRGHRLTFCAVCWARPVKMIFYWPGSAYYTTSICT
jgi:hypothetical protein